MEMLAMSLTGDNLYGMDKGQVLAAKLFTLVHEGHEAFDVRLFRKRQHTIK